MAGDAGAPVVGFVRSGGARLQEGHAALAGYGRIFRASVELSRKVPQISILYGISAGGGAYSPALTDFVAMTQDSRMFLTGPKVVAEAMGEEISMEDLGGPARPRQERRRPAGRPRRRAGDRPDPPPAGAAAAADRRRAAASHEPVGPDGTDPGLVVPERAAQGLRRARGRRRDPRPGQLPRDLAALGAEHGHRRSPGSKGARSAWSPTSRGRSAA